MLFLPLHNQRPTSRLRQHRLERRKHVNGAHQLSIKTPPARQPRFSLQILTAAGLLATGCTSTTNGDTADTRETDEPNLVLVTMDIWSDVVANVGCGQSLRIETLIPPGTDPHGFEASLRDRTDLGQANLVIANGLELEEGLLTTISSAANDGTPTLYLGNEIEEFIEHRRDAPRDSDPEHSDDPDDEMTSDGQDNIERAGGGHTHEGLDPHIWFDPTLVAATLPVLRDKLVLNAGTDGAASERCVEDYRSNLEALDAEIRQMFEQIPAEQRVLVTNHGSLSYFAKRYDLDVVGTVIPSSSSLAEVNPAAIERLADLIEQHEVRVIFTEAGQSSDSADALGERLGVPIVALATASLGPKGSESETYLGWLRSTATLIADGLSR